MFVRRIVRFGLVGVVGLASILLWTALGAQAGPQALDPSVLAVNTTDDTDDGTCNAEHCSLREAVQAANTNAGPDTIAFNIPPTDPGYNASGWWTIRPASPLPELTDDNTTVDGTTQTVNQGDANLLGPEIELDGSLVSGRSQGLMVSSANNVIRGLVINQFTGLSKAIRLWGQHATNNLVVGNYLGTDPTGVEDRGNDWGIEIWLGAHDNTIGGESPAERNVISGNDQRGIAVGGTAHDNRIIGNFIGTTAQGSGPLGNASNGIVIDNGQENIVGPGNLIAFNEGGVRIVGGESLGNTVTANSVYSNTKGIILVNGGNTNLPSPVIVTASATTVQGTACAGCRVEIFSDSDDEGAVYEGFTTADGAGNFTFDKPAGLTGPNVTATATDEAGNTSEFSAPVPIAGTATPTPTSTPTGTSSPTPTASPTRTPTPTLTATVGAPPALVVNTTDDTDDGTCDAGHCSLREAINAANRYAGPATVAFDIPPSDPGYSAAPGVWTIRPARLYFLGAGVTIDGTTQTANRGDINPQGPEVEIDGSGHTPVGFDCFELTGDNVLRSLVINRCTADGVRVTGAGSSVAGNYIGTDPTGTLARPVQSAGVRLDQAQGNTIGGPTLADRNVISGNRWGIFIATGASGNTVRNNYVGTDARGTAPLGNARLGVLLRFGAQANQVGPGNVIAHNEDDGVSVEDPGSVGNTITRNSIHSNGGLGIDNVDGGNLELAPPVIALLSGGQVSGTACPGCTVEFFSDFKDEGRTFEGAAVADGAGNWSLDVSPAGPHVTATATDAAGNTSEFSAPAAVWRRLVYLPLVRR